MRLIMFILTLDTKCDDHCIAQILGQDTVFTNTSLRSCVRLVAESSTHPQSEDFSGTNADENSDFAHMLSGRL